MKKERASLVVKLEGKDSIKVDTLVDVLNRYKTITRLANDIVGGGGCQTSLKVNAFRSGSFEIELAIQTDWISSLFNRDNVFLCSSIVSGIAAAFQIYKHFKGRKVSKKEEPSLANVDEAAIELHNHEKFQKEMKEVIKKISADENIDGMTLIANGKPSETIHRSEFAELISDATEQADKRTIIDDHATLRIISLSFVKGEVWRFVYMGNIITTKLSDDGLQEAIDNGERFSKGDSLVVSLEITQRWDSDIADYMNDKWKVIKVLEHVEAKRTEKLPFAD